MKFAFNKPSGSYSVVMLKDELTDLINNGHITARTGPPDCMIDETGDGEEKVALNELMFGYRDPQPVQFLHIIIDDSATKKKRIEEAAAKMHPIVKMCPCMKCSNSTQAYCHPKTCIKYLAWFAKITED